MSCCRWVPHVADPVQDLVNRLAETERRLHALETAPRANRTSVRGGFTRWMLEGEVENPKLFIGGDDGGEDVSLRLNDEDGGPAEIFLGTAAGRGAFYILNDDGTVPVFQVFDGKMLSPLLSCAWQSDHAHTIDTFGRPVITGGSYERVWASYLAITTGQIFSNIFVNLGAGVTSAAVRIQATSPGEATQTVFEQTGITVSGFLAGAPWTVPDSIVSPAASPVGQVVVLQLEGKVTGGAGDLAVAPVEPVRNF